jgi:hypothetical protein
MERRASRRSWEEVGTMWTNQTLRTSLALGLIAFVGFAARAGSADGATMRGRPGEAKDIVLMELTSSGRLTDKLTYTDGTRFVLDWSLGLLHNTSDRSAFGGAMKIAVDGDGNRFGFSGRYRRWLSSDASIDVAPGLFVSSLDEGGAYAFPSPTVDVALNYKDKLGFVVGADALRLNGEGTELQIRAGVRFGGWLAPAGTAVLLGAAAAAFAAW